MPAVLEARCLCGWELTFVWTDRADCPCHETKAKLLAAKHRHQLDCHDAKMAVVVCGQCRNEEPLLQHNGECVVCGTKTLVED